MPTQPSVNLKGESPHFLCHFTYRPVRFQCHLSVLLTNTSERSLHTEVRQTLSTEPIAGRELDDGAVSFKTRVFLQKKELFEVYFEGVEEGGTVGWCAAI